MGGVLRLFLLCGVLMIPNRADSADIQRVMVLEMTSTGVDASIGRSLSEILALSIRKALPAATVLGQAELNSMLALEKQRDMLGCSSDLSCLAEIGGALGADHLAIGSVGRLGSVHLLTLKLVDTRHAKTIRHISEEVSGQDERLIEATRQWASHLVDPSRQAGFGYLTLLGTGPVNVDGQPVGVAPIERFALPPGEHRVEWLGSPVQTVRIEAYGVSEVAPPRPPTPEAGVEATAAPERLPRVFRPGLLVGATLAVEKPGDTTAITLEATGELFDLVELGAGFTAPESYQLSVRVWLYHGLVDVGLLARGVDFPRAEGDERSQSLAGGLALGLGQDFGFGLCGVRLEALLSFDGGAHGPDADETSTPVTLAAFWRL